VLLGYARWHLPLSVVLDEDGKEGNGEGGGKVWEEALVPRVSEEEEEEIGRVAESVEWDPKPGSARMFDGVREIKEEILGRKEFMRGCDFCLLDFLMIELLGQRR